MLTEEEKRERGREANRKWRTKNRERELERSRNRIYSEEEIKWRRIYSLEYYHKNRERLQGYRKDYYEENKDQLNRRTKEDQLLRNARTRAKIKGVPFDIKLTDIVIPEYCPVLGLKINWNNKSAADDSPSLDRIIPEKGYVLGNIQVISHRANSIKSFGTAEEHDLVAQYIRQSAN